MPLLPVIGERSTAPSWPAISAHQVQPGRVREARIHLLASICAEGDSWCARGCPPAAPRRSAALRPSRLVHATGHPGVRPEPRRLGASGSSRLDWAVLRERPHPSPSSRCGLGLAMLSGFIRDLGTRSCSSEASSPCSVATGRLSIVVWAPRFPRWGHLLRERQPRRERGRSVSTLTRERGETRATRSPNALRSADGGCSARARHALLEFPVPGRPARAHTYPSTRAGHGAGCSARPGSWAALLFRLPRFQGAMLAPPASPALAVGHQVRRSGLLDRRGVTRVIRSPA